MKPLLLLLKKQVHEIMSPDHPHLFETGIRKYQLVSMVPECLVSSSSFLWLVSENANDSSIFETNVWELQHMTSVVIFEAGVWERLCLISIFKTGCPRTPMPGRRVFWHLRTLTPLFKSCSLCRCVRKPMSRPLPFLQSSSVSENADASSPRLHSASVFRECQRSPAVAIFEADIWDRRYRVSGHGLRCWRQS